MALLDTGYSTLGGEFEEPVLFEPPKTVTTSSGQTFNYDDVVNLILSRYAEGKTPALAVKSALQLGFPEEVIRTLPGVDNQAFEAGKRLIQSGAFSESATGTMADIQTAAPVGSEQYNARIAAGLDAFGFPPEEVAKLKAQGLYGPGKQFDPGTPDQQIQSVQTEGLLQEEGDMVTPSIVDRLNSMPRNEFETVGFQEGGKDYSMDPNGLISVRDVGAKPTDEVQVFDQGGNFLATHAVEQRSDFVQAINQAGKVGIPAVIGAAILGPAGTGLLSTPTAAAVGSGGSTLLQGGSVEDALKAAALAGLTAYGLDYLTTTPTVTPESTLARELAASGLSEGEIADALISQGVSPKAAIEAASNTSPLPAIGANRGLEFAATGNAPGVIVTGGSAVAPGITAVAPAIAATFPVTSAATPGLLNQPADITNQQVQLQNQSQASTTALPAATGGLLTPTVPPPASIESQRVETTVKREVPVEDRPIPVMTMAPTIPVKATESVSVQGKKEPVPTATALIPAGAAGAAAGVTAPATPTSPFSATDAALAALLLGGAGSLLNQGGGTGFTMDQGLANSIINAPRPVYGQGVGGYQMPGMFQIAPTNVYNPFATTAPFGTGRFGGFSAPITLPRGLV